MKKVVLLAGLLTATSSGVFAQTEQGSVMLGSTLSQLSFAKSQDGVTKYFSGALAPNAGLFVVDRLAVGAQLLLAYESQKTEYSGFGAKVRSFEYGIAPFARYYFLNAPKHKFFGQAAYGITGYTTKYISDDEFGFDRKAKGSFGSGRASVGYDYFIVPAVALEVQPYFERTGRGQLANSVAHSWGLSVGFQIFLPKGDAAAGQ
ncbi:hypothetical protein [Hymenobacter metallicola]|uniref:Outer membrane protein beta-barrel domain-containing protein n=1 Tax=Hymenobacter metallicola TaxID=2563114 RepID=A0A4Z0QBH4_9BACT|nr:hypothetical protein [Hymenobacter metallicola]TGE26411.1 hypothetical protein E5K02_16580 [Hymenobacter metallicola]